MVVALRFHLHSDRPSLNALLLDVFFALPGLRKIVPPHTSSYQSPFIRLQSRWSVEDIYMVGLRVAVLAWPAHSSLVPHPLKILACCAGFHGGARREPWISGWSRSSPTSCRGLAFFHLGLNSKFGRVGLTQANSL